MYIIYFMLILKNMTYEGGIRVKFRSVFDIIGPIMIGPSSSHTAVHSGLEKLPETCLEEDPNGHIFIYMDLLPKLIKVMEQMLPLSGVC